MSGDFIGKFIYFWAFIIGVIVFGKIFGYMNDTKTSIIILVAAAIAYLIWTIGRSKAKQRSEEKAWEAQQAKIAAKQKKKKR